MTPCVCGHDIDDEHADADDKPCVVPGCSCSAAIPAGESDEEDEDDDLPALPSGLYDPEDL